MKIFSSEAGHDYKTYTFAYAQYAKKEDDDALLDIYDKGFLPYSGSGGAKNIFYMARSARIILPEFGLTSENRRIAKKFDGEFVKERVPLNKFKITEDFLNFCLEYFAVRHGPNVMPRERLEFVLACGLVSTIVVYRIKDKITGYVFEVGDEIFSHYWFSFYDLSLTKQSLGLWLMLDCVRDAKERGLKHYYIGTVYGEKALYKTNFEPLLWWNGKEWNRDVRLLKERGHSDNERIINLMDEWKAKQKFYE